MGRLLRAADSKCSGSTFTQVLLGLAALCALSGCNDYGPPKNTAGLQNLQPVVGSVSFDGEPTPGALVLFLEADDPEGTERRIAGVVEEDGSFEMKTTVGAGSRPGVEPGEYVVVITWNKLVDPTDRDSGDGPDLLPVKYKDHKTSGMRVKIEDGANELEPFVIVP